MKGPGGARGGGKRRKSPSYQTFSQIFPFSALVSIYLDDPVVPLALALSWNFKVRPSRR